MTCDAILTPLNIQKVNATIHLWYELSHLFTLEIHAESSLSLIYSQLADSNNMESERRIVTKSP